MIKKYSLLALQKAINKALALDESMPDKLRTLEGRILKIIITSLHTYFFIHFSEQGLTLSAESNQEADAVIHSSPLGLIRLSLLPASKVRSLFNDHIQITGDVAFGQQVKSLFDELNIDWEGHLAFFTGDVIAYQVGSLFRKGLSFKKKLTTSTQQQITEYLQEELKWFPPREEVDDFFHEVDTLSLDVERVEAQIHQLLATHETD